MLPSNYSWLNTVGVLPRMVRIGIETIGVAEVPGRGSNPIIMDWVSFLGLDAVYKDDDTAWCGLWMAYVSVSSGRDAVKNPLWARNWQNWGVHVRKPELGAVLVFRRQGGGGHVGLYIAQDANNYYVLGGNQKNKVGIDPIAKGRLIAARVPVYRSKPASARPYIISPTGQPVSINEA